MGFFKFDKPKAAYIYNILNLLIAIDIIGLIYVLTGAASQAFESYFLWYDLMVCIILISEFIIKFRMSSGSKKLFLKNNWIDLFASIPFDLILGTFFSSLRIIRFVRLLKMIRIASLLKKDFRILSIFVKSRSLDKILSYILITIILFSLVLFFADPKMNLFDSIWFVLATVTTVGYGDVTPKTFYSRVIALALVIFGVFVFSTITGAVSSYFTEKVLNINDETIEVKIEKIIDEKVVKELRDIRKENEELKEEIKELNDLINKKRD